MVFIYSTGANRMHRTLYGPSTTVPLQEGWKIPCCPSYLQEGWKIPCCAAPHLLDRTWMYLDATLHTPLPLQHAACTLASPQYGMTRPLAAKRGRRPANLGGGGYRRSGRPRPGAAPGRASGRTGTGTCLS